MKHLPLFLLLTLATAVAEVPSLINYQGRLVSADGSAQSGQKSFLLQVFDAANGGSLLYREEIGAITLGEGGVYSFQFGATGTSNGEPADITAAFTNGGEHWLQLTIDGQVQATRERILAVPFALYAAKSGGSFPIESTSYYSLIDKFPRLPGETGDTTKIPIPNIATKVTSITFTEIGQPFGRESPSIKIRSVTDQSVLFEFPINLGPSSEYRRLTVPVNVPLPNRNASYEIEFETGAGPGQGDWWDLLGDARNSRTSICEIKYEYGSPNSAQAPGNLKLLRITSDQARLNQIQRPRKIGFHITDLYGIENEFTGLDLTIIRVEREGLAGARLGDTGGLTEDFAGLDVPDPVEIYRRTINHADTITNPTNYKIIGRAAFDPDSPWGFLYRVSLPLDSLAPFDHENFIYTFEINPHPSPNFGWPKKSAIDFFYSD